MTWYWDQCVNSYYMYIAITELKIEMKQLVRANLNEYGKNYVKQHMLSLNTDAILQYI